MSSNVPQMKGLIRAGLSAGVCALVNPEKGAADLAGAVVKGWVLSRGLDRGADVLARTLAR